MTKLQSKELFSSQYFSVHENENGSHYVVACGGAAVIALDAQNRILLTREFRPKLNKVVWRIPAGKAEIGEDNLSNARREFREESGYDARKMELFIDFEGTSSLFHQRKSFFVATDLFESPLDTGDEIEKPEVHFLKPQQVLQLLNEGEILGDVAAALYRFLHVYKLI